MNHELSLLLRNAELHIEDFNMNTRTEMNYFGRTLNTYMFSYHKKGSAKLRIGDKTYLVEPGTVVFVPKHVIHDHYKETHEETMFLWWHFTYDIRNVIDVMKLFRIPTIFQLRNQSRFEEVFVEFMESTNSTYLPAEILKRAKSLELIYLILDSALSIKDAIIDVDNTSGFLSLLTQIIAFPERKNTLKESQDVIHPVVKFEDSADAYEKYVDQMPELSVKLGVAF